MIDGILAKLSKGKGVAPMNCFQLYFLLGLICRDDRADALRESVRKEAIEFELKRQEKPLE